MVQHIDHMHKSQIVFVEWTDTRVNESVLYLLKCLCYPSLPISYGCTVLLGQNNSKQLTVFHLTCPKHECQVWVNLNYSNTAFTNSDFSLLWTGTL